MGVFFTSDLHLGHKSIIKYRTEFKSIEDHDNIIFTELNKLSKRDVLYILGDFIFEGDTYEEYLIRISKLPCRIKLVMGNHDNKDLYHQSIARNIEVQLPLFSYKNNWVSHCPIHPLELRGRDLNIHGHLHYTNIPDNRYINVGLDTNNFKMVSWEEIKNKSKEIK